MPLFLKKNRMGRLIEADDGWSDPDITEIRLTPGEYSDMLFRIHQSEKIIDEAYAEKETAEKKNADAETEIDRLQQKLAEAYRKNENYKRISRERANSSRKLSPKKEHNGYLVIFSTQYRERYRNEVGMKSVADTWKTLLQTPYDCSLPLDLIEKDIFDDLMNDVLFPLGFREVQTDGKNGVYKKWFEEDDTGNKKEICGLYRWEYKANYKTGLWEIVLYHTLSISVPQQFRIRH